MEKTVKNAKLTVKKYLEKTGSKSNNIIKRGAKSNKNYSKLGKVPKQRTLYNNDHSVVEEAPGARKVNLKVSCQTNLGDIREGENFHFTQSEVTIPGTLGRY